VSQDALEYGALDGRPVRLFFLILGPGSAAGLQVRILSRVGRLLRDSRLRKRLESAADAEEFLRVLEEAEAAG
jgi:mannitol/fructose-specific phosphotransferase system IIA component (Ntr-type)